MASYNAEEPRLEKSSYFSTSIFRALLDKTREVKDEPIHRPYGTLTNTARNRRPKSPFRIALVPRAHPLVPPS